MKYMVISDIHGDIDKLNIVLDIFKKEECIKLLILGDLFNYGIDYNKEYIIDKLNSFNYYILASRGNCDTDTSDLVFDTPDINKTNINNKNIIITHGHIYSKEVLSNYDCDLVFIGHSHVPMIETINSKIFINPGSISKSRKGDNSFAIIDENFITIRNLDNKIILKYKI